ncbi:MAG: response regulator [Euryarchaeota archaeon]|nr:response regulator [Euryarchaeota archaeon]
MAKILFVDDEPDIGLLVTKILEEEGHEIRWVFSARECFRLLREYRPDLVIMDIFMPGTNGIEATRRIKRSHPELPVLMFSIMYGASDIEEAMRISGADDFLGKPFEREELLERVERLTRS